MKTLEQLSAVAEAIVSRLEGKTRDIEVRVSRSDGFGYEIKNRELAPELALGRVSVGLRALTEKGLAVAATSSLDIEENVRAIEAALGAAQATPLESFGVGEFAPDGSGHDEDWEPWAREPERLRDLAATIRDRTFAADAAREGATLTSLEGGVSFGTSWLALATRGGRAAFKRSSGGAFTQIDSSHYKVEHLERAPDAATVERVGALGATTLSEILPRSLTPSELGAGGGQPLPVILHPRQLETMLRYAAAEKFLGSSRNAGMTDLRAGQAVWDPAITLLDSGIEEGLSSRRPCDDELIATRATPLVEAGKVGALIYSRRSALEAGEGFASTGNGYRAPMLVEELSEAPIRDKLSGLVMAPGATPLEELIAGVERGIFLYACLGIHGADRARAAFSTTVYDGFAIEKGELTGMLAPGRWNVAGHLFPEGESKGMLGEVTLSAEQKVTGSGKFPWVLTHLDIG
ncbi:MAG: metallopeptidase TldD-related protein [Deltaproteobacteria bacterium]|nr:metallopeptidase TldD-related protein [Deltaproteobacteria bacterium]